MITKIQSVTDVITNSSSSVFVMNSEDLNRYENEVPADCLEFCAITYEWLLAHRYEVEMVCSILGVNPSEVTDYHDNKWGGYWETPDEEAWITFIELHKEEIEERFADYYWVEIEDHFEDAYEITHDAYGDAVWSESRH